MKPLKNMLFVQEFNHNITVINSIISCTVIIFVLILGKLCLYTFMENMDEAIKIATIVASLILVICMGVFKRFSVRALARISGHAGRYNALLAATRDIRAEQNSEVLCQKILDYAISMTRADAGAILQLVGGKLSTKVVSGSVSGVTPVSAEPTTVTIRCLTDGICQHGDDDSFAKGSLCAIDGMAGTGISSTMCHSLRGNAGAFGVIKLLHSQPDHFNADDEEVLEYFSSQAAISLENVRFVADHANFEQHMTNLLLQAMDNHLTIKVEHARRVARYAEIIALAINMSPERRNILKSACLLHDVGFIKFMPSDEMKPEVYLKHVTVGYSLLNQINFYQEEARIVLHHHERFDGQGYPDKLSGDAIPVESRIIAIGEVFDTITSKDSYREALGFSEALEEMDKHAGSQFDPVLLAAFIKNVGEIL